MLGAVSNGRLREGYDKSRRSHLGFTTGERVFEACLDCQLAVDASMIRFDRRKGSAFNRRGTCKAEEVGLVCLAFCSREPAG